MNTTAKKLTFLTWGERCYKQVNKDVNKLGYTCPYVLENKGKRNPN